MTFFPEIFRVAVRWRLFGAALILALVMTSQSGAELRTWTGRDGRQIEATLIGVYGAKATIVRADGVMFDLGAERLSADDLAYIREWIDQNQGQIGTLPLSPIEWPDRVRVRAPEVEVVEEEGESNIYRTPHFEFRCSVRLSRDLIRRLGTVFEATYATVDALPIGLAPEPPRGDEYWVTVLYPTREAFMEAGGGEGFGAQYSRASGQVMVPLDTLDVRRTSSSFSYSQETDPSVLIHEVVHQLTHSWLVAGMPRWLSEGLADYMEGLPYRGGTFGIREYDIGEYVRARNRRSATAPWRITSVETLLNFQRSVWNHTLSEQPDLARMNYYSATLLVYYFLYYDGNGDARRLIRYLQALKTGVGLEHRNEILLAGRSYEELQDELLKAFDYRGLELVVYEPTEEASAD